MNISRTRSRVAAAAFVAIAILFAASFAGAQSMTRDAQLARLKTLLQDKSYALEMATWLDAAYYKGQGQTPPPFVKPEEESATAAKSVKEEKIAINLAGFYAVEAGIGFISEKTGKTPVEILEAIVAGTLGAEDMLLLARFANATWKASQPFRSLSRITRDTFRPAALLTKDELMKDYVQVKSASEKLLESMRAP
jgi:hypothetical protein